MIVTTSLIGEVIDEPHQGPGTANEGVMKVFERLVHSYYWTGMKRDLQVQLPQISQPFQKAASDAKSNRHK